MQRNTVTAVKSKMARFAADESGATAIEYAVIAGIVSIALVGGLSLARDSLNSGFASVSGAFQTALAS